MPPTISRLILAACLLALGAAAWYLKRAYLDYQKRIDELIARLPPGEADPPPDFREIVLRLNPDGYRYFVTRHLLNELHPAPTHTRDWHLRALIWQVLLPIRLRMRKFLALYAHFMPFEEGRGLVHGARFYYEREPAELSTRELLELYVISLAPDRNSPRRDPERLATEVHRVEKNLGRPLE